MLKVGIKNAFWLKPVLPDDMHLLAMWWHNEVYIDGGVKAFQLDGYVVLWILTQQGIQCILHYLDDFRKIGPPQSPLCQQDLHKFIHLCNTLGNPLALEKDEGPSTSLSILEITLDMHHMEICLPQDNRSRIQEMLLQWLSKKKASQRKILS